MSVYEKVYPFLVGIMGTVIEKVNIIIPEPELYDYVLSCPEADMYGKDAFVGMSVQFWDDGAFARGTVLGNSAVVWNATYSRYEIGINVANGSYSIEIGEIFGINYFYDLATLVMKGGKLYKKNAALPEFGWAMPLSGYFPESFENWLGVRRMMSKESLHDIKIKIGRLEIVNFGPPRGIETLLWPYYYDIETGMWQECSYETWINSNTIEEVDLYIHKLYEQTSTRRLVPIIVFPSVEGVTELEELSIMSTGERLSYDRFRVVGYVLDAAGNPVSGYITFTALFTDVPGVGLINRDASISVQLDEKGFFNALLFGGKYKVEYPSKFAESRIIEVNNDMEVL